MKPCWLCSSFGFLHSYFQDACMASDVCRFKAKHKWTLTPGAAYFKYCDVDKFKCSVHSRQCWHFLPFCFNSLIYCRCMIALKKIFPFLFMGKVSGVSIWWNIYYKNLPAFVWIDGVRHILSLAPVILGVRCIFLSVTLYSSLFRGYTVARWLTFIYPLWNVTIKDKTDFWKMDLHYRFVIIFLPHYATCKFHP